MTPWQQRQFIMHQEFFFDADRQLFRLELELNHKDKTVNQFLSLLMSRHKFTLSVALQIAMIVCRERRKAIKRQNRQRRSRVSKSLTVQRQQP